MSGRPPWGNLADPAKNRTGEQIGAGFFVMGREEATGRIRPKRYPFEHPTEEEAVHEATRLAAANPGRSFEALARAGGVFLAIPPLEERTDV